VVSSGIPAVTAVPPRGASLADIARLRLHGHGLAAVAPPASSASAGPLAVVQRLLAMQAQDLTASTWALGGALARNTDRRPVADPGRISRAP